MKLISVQSRGNRLAVVESSAQVPGVGYFTCNLKSMGKRKFLTRDYRLYEHKSGAMGKAAEWLEGATV